MDKRFLLTGILTFQRSFTVKPDLGFVASSQSRRSRTTKEITMDIRFILAASVVAITPALAMAQDNTAATTSDAGQAFKDANQKMMDDMMGMQPSGDPDMDFTMMMIPHHQGAVDMAKIELKYGKDKALRAMAKKIVVSQEKEIAEMKAWQAKHGH